ncbi:MAG: amino acid permease [Fimbriimonadaceae bacterium]|nr:amino acid permease [Fimbriimonadaceae bacterium]
MAQGASSSGTEHGGLLRTMGLGALAIYGIGDMLGAGVYGLMGKAAGTMGNAVWLAFAVSMVAALLTGLSYASLGSRYPRAAGAAYITQRAFGFAFLSYVIGLAVMASGLTSMATQSRVFAEYSGKLLGELPPHAFTPLVVAFIAAMTLINFWGIKESTWLNLVCTAVEVSGLLIVLLVGVRYWGSVNLLEVPPAADGTPGQLGFTLLLSGAVLTFYSFIGFEDMLNVVEEVKDPVRTFPRAVVLALAAVTVSYMAIAVTAVSVVPWAELQESKQPLVDVVTRAAPWFPPRLYSLIALFAITNTMLLNYIMGSRLAYGMAQQGLLPRWIGAIHPTRRTPHRAILVLMAIVLVLALVGDIKDLARATSILLLSVFILVNTALLVLQRRPGEPRGSFEVPAVVPAGGILVCATMLYHAKWPEVRIALFLLAGIALLYLWVRPRHLSAATLAELSDELPGDPRS